MRVRIPCLPLGPDSEMEIIPRFYRGVPGSSPGRGAYMRRERKGYPTGDGNRLEAGRAICLAGSIPAPSAERSLEMTPPMVKRKSRLGPNEAVRVRLPVGAYMVFVV